MILAALLPLLGAAALFEHYALTRQRLQLRVDTAVEYGARAIASGLNVADEVHRNLASRSALRPGDLVEVEQPPREGRFRAWKRAVRVRVRARWSPPLVPRSLADRLPLDVRATAVAVPPGPGHPMPVALRVE
jgi:hypothetical protein